MSRIRLLKQVLGALLRRNHGDFAAYKAALANTGFDAAVLTATCALSCPLPTIDVDALRAMAPDSFGSALAHFIDGNGLAPLAISAAARARLAPADVPAVRYVLLHDAFHVLLGYDASLAGELGVWTFVACQGYSPAYARAARLASLFYTLADPASASELRAAEARARFQARYALPLLVQPLETYFDLPLDEVRKRLRILCPPPPGRQGTAYGDA